jgi:hypothetical protein
MWGSYCSEEDLRRKTGPFAVKIHNRGKEAVVAVCDPDCFASALPGPGGAMIRIAPPFFGEERMEGARLLECARVANCLSFVGKSSVQFALDNRIGNKESVVYLGETPYLMVMKL